MRVDVCGRTCGVETKCMFSLHSIRSGMRLIKREESIVGSLSSVRLCFIELQRVHNFFSHHKFLLWVSLF